MSNPRISGIYMLALADTLIEKARYLRRIIILDCCFAAAAFSAFQSGPDEVAVQKTMTAFLVNSKSVGFPARGTSLLCSSNQKSPSLLLPDNSSTMFTKAFLDALEEGAPSRGSRLSLRDVKDIAADQLYEIQNAPKPVVLSPDQSEGDIADIPLFPNPQSGQMSQAEEETHVLYEESVGTGLVPVRVPPTGGQGPALSLRMRIPLLNASWYNQQRKRIGLVIALITLVLVLVSSSILIATYVSKSAHTPPLTTPISAHIPSPTPSINAQTPSPTPTIDAATLSPEQLYNTVTSRSPFYSSNLIQQDDNANWEEIEGSCSFAKGVYEATVQQSNSFITCLEQGFSLTDFAFQVQMTILSGDDRGGGGLIFRDASSTNLYRLRIGPDGSYDVSSTDLSDIHFSSAINQGLSHTNLLTVIAQGNLLFFYVNKQLIAHTSSSFSNQGKIGFMAVGLSQPADVIFTDVQVWKL